MFVKSKELAFVKSKKLAQRKLVFQKKVFLMGVSLENMLLHWVRKVVYLQNLALLEVKSLVQKSRGSDHQFVSARSLADSARNERGDVPGWVLVVLMTAGLVTGIWTVAAPRLNQILRNSLDSMNSIR